MLQKVSLPLSSLQKSFSFLHLYRFNGKTFISSPSDRKLFEGLISFESSIASKTGDAWWIWMLFKKLPRRLLPAESARVENRLRRKPKEAVLHIPFCWRAFRSALNSQPFSALWISLGDKFWRADWYSPSFWSRSRAHLRRRWHLSCSSPRRRRLCYRWWSRTEFSRLKIETKGALKRGCHAHA